MNCILKLRFSFSLADSILARRTSSIFHLLEAGLLAIHVQIYQFLTMFDELL